MNQITSVNNPLIIETAKLKIKNTATAKSFWSKVIIWLKKAFAWVY